MSRVMSKQMVEECIEITTKCANVCQESIDYCLQQGGKHVQPHHMKSLIDCAEICRTCDDYLLRRSEHMGEICGVCADVCVTCAESCASMTGDKKMQECADICNRCADACRRMA